MRGPSYENGIEVFTDIIVKYAIWLERIDDIYVLGFFDSPVSLKKEWKRGSKCSREPLIGIFFF